MKNSLSCARLTAMMSQETGTYIIQTFGCQMNMHDSERMEEVLHADGWRATDRADAADLIIFNTCSVREKAEQKLRSEVGKIAALKQTKPGLLVAVAGCVAQQEGERLLKQLPLVDLVVGPDNLAELSFLLREQLGGAPPQAKTVFDTEHPVFLRAQPQPGQVPVSSFVTTMKGCDERCSFCIVPYTRGPERYRPAQEILEEAARLVECGAKEIILLGQTVDSYQDPSLPPKETDHPDESQFPQLLRLLAQKVPGLARLRYTSPHPRHATASLARAHAELDVLARHIHMPVQSGSNRILKRMIRRYTREEYIERVSRLKASRPGLTLSTDIIVGFPGETEEDFQATLSLVQEVGFTSVYAFKYSVRPYTPARKLIDDVPVSVKDERLQHLFEVVESQGQKHLSSLVGTKQSVLIEGPSKFEPKPESQPTQKATLGIDLSSKPISFQRYQGRTHQNELVHLAAPLGYDMAGALVEVTIQKAHRHSLWGELSEETKESAAFQALATPKTQPRMAPKPKVRLALVK